MLQRTDSDRKEEEKRFEELAVGISQREQSISSGKKVIPGVSKDDFTLIKVIGTGSYGKVLLVRKKDSGKHYAMKILKKKHLKEKKQVKNTWAERKILEKIHHPFIVKLNYAFHTDRKLFFVLDYCPGGELFFYISSIGRFKECSAKFYAANILLALECLHENGIIYRE
jgi:serum/glucocorticoid-regulated kinase 2